MLVNWGWARTEVWVEKGSSGHGMGTQWTTLGGPPASLLSALLGPAMGFHPTRTLDPDALSGAPPVDGRWVPPSMSRLSPAFPTASPWVSPTPPSFTPGRQLTPMAAHRPGAQDPSLGSRELLFPAVGGTSRPSPRGTSPVSAEGKRQALGYYFIHLPFSLSSFYNAYYMVKM